MDPVGETRLQSSMLSSAPIATSATRVGLYVNRGYLFFLGFGGMRQYQSRGEGVEATEEAERGIVGMEREKRIRAPL